jgi:hypothetical protein
MWVKTLMTKDDRENKKMERRIRMRIEERNKKRKYKDEKQ